MLILSYWFTVSFWQAFLSFKIYSGLSLALQLADWVYVSIEQCDLGHRPETQPACGLLAGKLFKQLNVLNFKPLHWEAF